MFKRFNATKSAEASTKPSQIEQGEDIKEPKSASEQREVSDGREGSAAADLQREAAESRAGSSDHQRDVPDEVIIELDNLPYASEITNEDEVRKCEITKEKKKERIGLSLRKHSNSSGIYVHRITAGSKIEATGIQVGDRIVSINGKPCPTVLSGAVSLLTAAPSRLVIEVTQPHAPCPAESHHLLGGEFPVHESIEE
eukprot:scaffold1775_cov83-Cylindrotheca_fusiformis.AAC.7